VRVLSVYALGLLPIVLATLICVSAWRSRSLGIDFHEAFWPAGRAVLGGRTPYPPVDPHVLAQGKSFVYPPVVAIALAPLALLPASIATAVALLVTVASLAGTLWVLGVRDWRCYGAVLAAPAVLLCIQTAALSGLVALAIALAWRLRARGVAALVLVAIVIAVKLFLWPLVLWVYVVRGVRCALLTAVGAGVIVVAPWLLGFPGLMQYPDLLSTLTDVEGAHAYTPRALALALGATPRLAEAVAVVVGSAVLTVAALATRRPDAARRVLALTLLAALLLSPVVWSHYLVILLPVIAIGRPRMAWAWLAPIALWMSGGAWNAPTGPRIALGLVALGLATLPGLVALRAPRSALA
jgi:hypothetical protein